MFRYRPLRSLLIAAGIAALVAGAASAQAQQYDTSQPYDTTPPYNASEQAPGRVARLAYLSGQVQFAPAGENDWGSVQVNRPMVVGDRLLTGDDGRAVLELGDASVRIDNDSAFDFLNLDAGNVQIELSQGTLNLAVRQLDQGANFEVDTPTLAFVAATPGVYRIDNSPSGVGSMVTVFQGSGTVYGENGASRQVVAGTSYRFNDSTLANVDVNGLPNPDDFDRFCETRDSNYARYAQQEQQYVPPDMIGGDDLYQYGQWNDTPEYGNVWYPNSVPAGWAPYRNGHWAWIDPWGWTWVGDEPWGFAPFHYGRWVYARDRWGWMPGPVQVRPVYAPALVAFIGGSGFSVSLNLGGGGPVGWFPLGPRDVYMPWFRASRGYFNNVNVTNIRNVYVNKTVINNFYGDYQAGRAPRYGRNDYAYRDMQRAVTVVPRNVFANARPVRPAVVKVDRKQLARGEVAARPAINPGRASLGLRQATPRPALLQNRKPFTRPVVARHQPAPRAVPFAAREKVIARSKGQPLTPAQLAGLRKTQPVRAVRNERVKLVPAVAAGVAAGAVLAHERGNEPRRNAPAQPTNGFRNTIHPIPARQQPPRTAEPPVMQRAPSRAGFRNTIHPIPARKQPAQPATPPADRPKPSRAGFGSTVHPIPAVRQPQPLRAGELPSARFRRTPEPATLPRAQVIRPAERAQRPAPTERQLPVVRPVERAPQPTANRAEQAQRQADIRAQEQARTRQADQQRQLQQQAQQRVRNQQAVQQRQAEQQQRARQQQQMQQQRQQQAQRQMQAQEQQRGMQMQRQQERAMQMQRQQERERVMPRAPQNRAAPARVRATPERRAPERKRPPASSSDQRIR